MRRATNLTKALTEHFLQGNVPLRHLLNAKPPFMSWTNEVNDWALYLDLLWFGGIHGDDCKYGYSACSTLKNHPI